jgi:hypothetical protein
MRLNSVGVDKSSNGPGDQHVTGAARLPACTLRSSTDGRQYVYSLFGAKFHPCDERSHAANNRPPWLRVPNQLCFGSQGTSIGELCFVEKRANSRQRVLKGGMILFGDGGVDCTIRNLSTNGAMLNVATPVGLPDEFTLLVQKTAQQQSCRVIWRSEKQIGVVFT